jgi:hypothetical protein
MRRTWFRRLLVFAVLGSLAAQAPVVTAAPRKSGSASTTRAKNALHQFTGVVTALDKQSLTVEKSGKQPMTRTFARHEEMSVVGDLVKDARVTVYYRDEGGRSVARRVVVKEGGGETAAR